MANYSVVHDTVYKYDHSFHGLKACFKRRISSASHLVQMSKNHCLSLLLGPHMAAPSHKMQMGCFS